MGTLRQGGMFILQYYDEVEKKLTLLTNKAHMTYDISLAKGMCEKFRGDALRVFISGLKRSLTDVLFSAHPPDLPTALALAQEVEANHERYAFATSYARGVEEKGRSDQRQQGRQNQQSQGTNQSNQNHQGKNVQLRRRCSTSNVLTSTTLKTKIFKHHLR
ncbi:GL22922 [Drosophila persimilis]|uniref:GL22922 n=1 Tax=Drosophila persimilis TaxID=7234 RepID=B4HC04_DROPE|nr:GL22922 [Drosophila persimilis]